MQLRLLYLITTLVGSLLLCSCGSEGDTPVMSSGLKIFVTSRVHNGNFLNDTTLTGATAIAKADDFCQTDPSRPSNGTYKALLADGTYRNAVTPVDWVLKPNTAYFRPFNNVRIGVTTAAAVFATASNFLDNSVNSTLSPSRANIWTGLADAATFGASPNNCQGWTTSLNADSATIGIAYATDAAAFYTNGSHACTLAYRLYCVEQ